jgi:uncharacterized protein DUF6776
MIRKFRRRFGISAPNVTVKTQIAWYWRWLGLVLGMAVAVAVALWMYDAGRRFAGFDRSELETELATVRERLVKLEAENKELSGLAHAGEARLQIERTAQQQLASQVKVLEDENARLKEDLGFFENLMPAEARDPGLSINRFRIDPDAVPDQFRYRLLLLQNGKRVAEFQGRLQLIVTLRDGLKDAILTLPAEGSADAKPDAKTYRINFRYFQRIEGMFQVPKGSTLKSVQVRVLENGVAKATQTLNMS